MSDFQTIFSMKYDRMKSAVKYARKKTKDTLDQSPTEGLQQTKRVFGEGSTGSIKVALFSQRHQHISTSLLIIFKKREFVKLKQSTESANPESMGWLLPHYENSPMQFQL